MTIADTTTIVIALGAVLLLLGLLTLWLAWRHDAVLSVAGPLREIEVLQKDIAQLQALRTAEEAQLADARRRVQRMAEIEAEVAAREARLDTLEAEWAQSAARRAEVQALRHEIEAAATERQRVAAELDEVTRGLDRGTGQLAEMQDRIARAEELVARIATLGAERDALEAELAGRRADAAALRAAEERLEQLAARQAGLEARNAQLDGRIAHREDMAAELDTRAAAAREALATAEAERGALRDELVRLRGERGLVRDDLDDLTDRSTELGIGLATRSDRLADLDRRIVEAEDLLQDLDAKGRERTALGAETDRLAARAQELHDAIVTLEARRAHLAEEVGGAGGASPAGRDPLEELRRPPQVIETLAALGTAGGADPGEADALGRVRQRFEAFGLDYPPRVIAAFHTAMKVNETTQMAILAGISGTGKSQLPRQYAAGMGIGFLQVPVQPRWDSPQDLMGFYNYIEGRFRPTDMARALWALDGLNNPDAVGDRMMMILLDEMNLARVEYYFSDFLSRLESRPARDRVGDRALRKDAEIELEIPRAGGPVRIFPGYNLLFAGTMNEDESTQALSDKVVDRANLMRFAAPGLIRTDTRQGSVPAVTALSRRDWARWSDRGLAPGDARRVDAAIAGMAEVMAGFGRPFGHRLGRAIRAYAAAYPDLGGPRLDEALADQIEMRLLPKLRGVPVDLHEPGFGRLQQMAQDLGDDALAEAIGQSLDQAAELGQFAWLGVSR